MSFCIHGVFVWLLVIWTAAGSLAILTIFFQVCRRRWNKIDDEETDWQQSLEAACRPTSAAVVEVGHLRSASSSTSLQSCRVIQSQHSSPMVLPKIPPPPPPPKAIQQQQQQQQQQQRHQPHTSPRHPDLIVVDRRHPNAHSIMKSSSSQLHHDRRLQSVEA